MRFKVKMKGKLQFYSKNEGVAVLRVRFLGSVYEAHQEADRRSKTVTLKIEPPKTEPI